MSLLTTSEVAERLGVTVPRVHALIRVGRLPAEKMGRDYFIKEADLKLVENRKPGRPPKAKPAQSSGKKKGKK
jgi:excisionase family DNA binding protein